MRLAKRVINRLVYQNVVYAVHMLRYLVWIRLRMSCLLEGSCEPFKTLIETVTRGGASRLDVLFQY